MFNQFKKVLDTITPVNIREVIQLSADEGATIRDKHLVITVVDTLKASANAIGYDFCQQNGVAYFYNGCYWQQLASDEVRQLLRMTAIKMQLNKYTAEYHGFADSLYKQFCASASLIKEDGDETIKINLQNGTFQFHEDGYTLQQFNKSDFLTYQLPFSYDHEAQTPLFMQYLNRVLPDVNCQNALAEYIGYVFTKKHKHEKCLILYGSGANGKSVFFNIICALLGKENLTSYSLRQLGDPNTRAQINNKLLNYSSEIDAGVNKDIFKQLVSGESVQAKILYKDVFMIHNYAKLMFNCNELPRDVEYNTAYFRRWLIIPFTQTIPQNEQDKDLANKIIASELPGVFNWVLAGLQRLTKQGCFTNSDLMENALQAFQQDADPVYQFISQYSYSTCQACRYGLTDLYQEFSKFCPANGFKVMNIGTFRKRLEMHGIKVVRRNTGNRVCVEKVAQDYGWREDDEDYLNELPF